MQYIETKLEAKTADIARAIKSLQEELEAVNFYQQRADSATDPELKAIIEHNRNEEIEHSCMLIEWLRRNMPTWDADLKKTLFTSSPLGAHSEETQDSKTDGDLNIRNMH